MFRYTAFNGRDQDKSACKPLRTSVIHKLGDLPSKRVAAPVASSQYVHPASASRCCVSDLPSAPAIPGVPRPLHPLQDRDAHTQRGNVGKRNQQRRRRAASSPSKAKRRRGVGWSLAGVPPAPVRRGSNSRAPKRGHMNCKESAYVCCWRLADNAVFCCRVPGPRERTGCNRTGRYRPAVRVSPNSPPRRDGPERAGRPRRADPALDGQVPPAKSGRVSPLTGPTRPLESDIAHA